MNKELEDILHDAFVGLYGKSPDDTGMNFDFVPMEDSFGVMHNSLAKDLLAWRDKAVKEALERVRDNFDYTKDYGMQIDPLDEAIKATLKELQK